jgi:hypothetical protein
MKGLVNSVIWILGDANGRCYGCILQPVWYVTKSYVCDSGSWTSCTLSTTTPLASLWVGSMSNSLIVFSLPHIYHSSYVSQFFIKRICQTDCCPTKMLWDQNDVSFDNAEQDLLKAFGGAYVNASLAIITKLGRVQVLVKYFISPPFCRIHKRCCLAPATVKPILHKTEQICGRVGTNYKTKLSCVCWSHNTGDEKELQFWSFADFCVCCGFFHSIPLCKLSGHLFDSGVSVQGELASQMCKILHKCDIYMFYLEYIWMWKFLNYNH